MSTREQRLRELLLARHRLDERIAEYNVTARIAALPPMKPVRDPMVKVAVYARELVHTGHTHAEIATILGVDPAQVAPLIEVGRRAAA